jgi:hypothetical protein
LFLVSTLLDRLRSAVCCGRLLTLILIMFLPILGSSVLWPSEVTSLLLRPAFNE